jgi:hypothetical protein
MAKKKLSDVFERDENGWYKCKSCTYSTPHENRARRHAQIEHLVELEPIRLIVPKKGTPDDTILIVEEVENG